MTTTNTPEGMLNTDELTIETVFVDYPNAGNVQARNDYYAEIGALERKWAAWLAYEYASGLPETVTAQIYVRAWSDGHSAGYSEVESHYQNHTEFARTIIAAAKAAV